MDFGFGNLQVHAESASSGSASRGTKGSTDAILPLSTDVAAQIKSSTTVTSLVHVILELLKNSLDSGACKISCSVDFSRGACAVEDDGLGIKPKDFQESGGLGKLHHTSKNRNISTQHGGNGTFLASLAALSILTITSHHHAHGSFATLVFHHSRPAARLIPAPSHHELVNRDQGTRVEVHDLFGNMPVRVKWRTQESSATKEREKEWEILRKNAVGLLVAWHLPVNLKISDEKSNKTIQIRHHTITQNKDRGEGETSGRLALPILCSVLSQAGYIEPKDWQTWVKTSGRASSITIQGALSLRPAPTKQVQFISLGVRHLEAESSEVLYESINRLFLLSDFGNIDDVSENESRKRKRRGKGEDRRHKHNGFTVKQLKSGGKSVDRWPMFIIRIDLQDDSLQMSDSRSPLDREGILSDIVKILEAMVTGFLKDHYFRPRAKRRKSRHSSSENMSFRKDQDLRSVQQTWRVPSSPSGLRKSNSAAKTPNISSSERSQLRLEEDSDRKTVMLPEFHTHHSQYFGESFSNWSRIKSGNPDGLENGFSTSKSQGEDLAKRNRLLCQKLGCLQSSGSASENQIPTAVMKTSDPRLCAHNVINDDQPADVQTNPDEQQPDQNIDTTVMWTNPLSNAAVLINARTGLVVSGISKKIRSMTTDFRSSARSAGSPVLDWRVARCASTPAVPKEDSWVSNFLKGWDNPVFKPMIEPSIPQISFDRPLLEKSSVLPDRYHRCSDHDLGTTLAGFPYSLSSRFSRSSLKDAKIISQVDKKFILVLMRSSPNFISDQNGSPSGRDQIMVLIDQHAADERIRVEALLADLCSRNSSETFSLASSSGARISTITTALIPKPLCFQIQRRDHRMFAEHAQHFARWGILYDLSPVPEMDQIAAAKSPTHTITVKMLPPCIAERCRLEPRILIELLRGEVWKQGDTGIVATTRLATSDPSGPTASSRQAQETEKDDWVQLIGGCPQGILDLLNSRSCRSAIMFNDELGMEECEALVRGLAECKFPFQCAHGRPSMIPLVAVNDWEEKDEGKKGFDSLFDLHEEDEGFGDAWLRWKGRISERAEE